MDSRTWICLRRTCQATQTFTAQNYLREWRWCGVWVAPQFHVSVLGNGITEMGTHHMYQVDVVTPAEKITWQFSDSACSRDTPQVRALTPPLPSRDWQSSGSSTTSTSSDETSSSISISNDMSLASGEENGERTGPSMISSKVFKWVFIFFSKQRKKMLITLLRLPILYQLSVPIYYLLDPFFLLVLLDT